MALMKIKWFSIFAVVLMSGLTWSACGDGQTNQGTNAVAATPVKKDTDVVKDWNGNIALGLSMARGNSDILQFNASGLIGKDWKQDEWRLGADAAYGLNNWGRSNEQTSANSAHAFVDYKHLCTERFYGSADLDLLHDDVAKLRYRVTVGPAAGYFFIKSDATRFSLEAGPSYINERLGDENKSYLTLRISERFRHEFGKTCKVWEQIDYMPQVDDWANYLVNSEAGTEVTISARLALRVTVQDKYNSQPAAGSKNNDILLLTSIVWRFGQ
jgi:putative salt-induced outer membrane protein YdiY